MILKIANVPVKDDTWYKPQYIPIPACKDNKNNVSKPKQDE